VARTSRHAHPCVEDKWRRSSKTAAAAARADLARLQSAAPVAPVRMIPGGASCAPAHRTQAALARNSTPGAAGTSAPAALQVRSRLTSPIATRAAEQPPDTAPRDSPTAR